MEAWIDAPLPCLIADRAYDRDGFRAWRAQRDIKAVLPARRGHLNPQPHDPEKYKARKAVERGLGGLKQWRRVATRYDKYAQRFLGFLYLAAAWALAAILNQHALIDDNDNHWIGNVYDHQHNGNVFCNVC